MTGHPHSMSDYNYINVTAASDFALGDIVAIRDAQAVRPNVPKDCVYVCMHDAVRGAPVRVRYLTESGLQVVMDDLSEQAAERARRPWRPYLPAFFDL